MGGWVFFSIAPDLQVCTLKSHARAPACHQTPSIPVELIDSIFELFEDGQAALATHAAAHALGLAQGTDTSVLVRVLYVTTLTRPL